MSDEAHFHLSGYVNKQNCRYWKAEDFKIIHEFPLYSQKVSFWCSMTCRRIIGPYFFENENRANATIKEAFIENAFTGIFNTRN